MKTQLVVLMMLATTAGAASGEEAMPTREPVVAKKPAGTIGKHPVQAPKRPARDLLAAQEFDHRFLRILDDVRMPNGLVLDRRSNRDIVSCAATGFNAYALALMADRGSLERTEVLDFVRRGLHTTLSSTPDRNRGWLYHFTDAEGRPQPWSEVSTVDSAIFYLGFLRAAETLGDPGLLEQVRAAISRVDTGFMLRDGYFLHGLHWQEDTPRFLNYMWDDTSEGVMLYRLFNLPFQPRIVRHDYPLFAYFYPLCFFDDADYSAHLRAAVHYQTSTLGYTGVTASDSPYGYQADDPLLISPLALFALSGLFPEARATLAKYSVDHMVPAYHVNSGWVAPDRVTIDYASAYILMVRPQSDALLAPVG